MLFETTKYNYIFIAGFWVFTIVFELILYRMTHINVLKQEDLAWIVLSVPTVLTLSFCAYLALYLAVKTFTNILGSKLKRTKKNLTIYAIRSITTLTMIFVDLVTLMAIASAFYSEVFDLENKLAFWQTMFVHVGFPLMSVFLTWNLRNHKMEFE